MQTAPSGRDDTIHKQLLIPKQTTPSIKNGKNMQTTPSVNKLNYRRWPGMSSQNGDVALIDIVLNVHMWSYHKSRIQT